MAFDDINTLMKQLTAAQEKIGGTQKKLQEICKTGKSGGKWVQITLDGVYEVRNVKLQPELFEEDVEVIEDLIMAAFNDAVRQIAEQNRVQWMNLKDVITTGLKEVNNESADKSDDQSGKPADS